MTTKQLIEQIHLKKSFLCIGLDVDLTKIPSHLLKEEDPIFSFNKAIIDATHHLCVAYKPNTAFYEAYGIKGWKSLEKTISYINKNYPEIFTIADAKRGDIGNTSSMYAKAFFEDLAFDSVTVAPALTLTDKEYQILRNASIKVLRKIGVDTGGSNVQFAINPEDGEINVIEMNPRVSRSSALASKATGFPIAKIAAKLAVGYTLDELENDITTTTPASFEPTIDYVVTKIPRFTFEKFVGANSDLTTSMKSVGEAMSIGRSFNESIQKGFNSLEYGLTGFDKPKHSSNDKNTILNELKIQSSQRLLVVGEALRIGLTVDEINQTTKYDKWFLYQIKTIIDFEKILKEKGLNKKIILYAKKIGFSDSKISSILSIKEEELRKEEEKQKRIEEENERIRLAEEAQKERIEEENRRMKEWEKKFDEEQRLKEEELVRKFYSDETPVQENNQDGDNLETKTDNKNLENKNDEDNLKN